MRLLGQHYAVCPNGHGRLVRKFTKAEARRATLAKLPEATRVNRKHFTIEGHKGLWEWINIPLKANEKARALKANQVVAKYMPGGAMWVRMFTKITKDSE
jgi:hypothetical protein